MRKNILKLIILAICLVFSSHNALAFELPKISNPFNPPIAPKDEGKPTDIVYNGFKDIPIPEPMLLDSRNSSVSTLKGITTGIEIYTGRLEIASLNDTMRENMRNHQWILVAFLDNSKYIQVYQKGNLLAIISLSKQTINTGLEVVVLNGQGLNTDGFNSSVNNAVQTYSEEIKD